MFCASILIDANLIREDEGLSAYFCSLIDRILLNYGLACKKHSFWTVLFAYLQETRYPLWYIAARPYYSGKLRLITLTAK